MSEWISIKDRFPAFSETVIASAKIHNSTLVTIAYFNESTKEFDWVVPGLFTQKPAVTHWMPLPEPPKDIK